MEIRHGVHLGTVCVPALEHAVSSGPGALIQRQHLPVGVLLQKAVQMVALFLEFTALQFCQILNAVNIVKTVPVGMNLKSAGIEGFQ